MSSITHAVSFSSQFWSYSRVQPKCGNPSPLFYSLKSSSRTWEHWAILYSLTSFSISSNSVKFLFQFLTNNVWSQWEKHEAHIIEFQYAHHYGKVQINLYEYMTWSVCLWSEYQTHPHVKFLIMAENGSMNCIFMDEVVHL